MDEYPASAPPPAAPPAQPTIVATVKQAAQNHPTTASAGLGGALSIVIMSILMHMNIHITEEEAIAWTSLITAFLGWLLRVLSHRFPVLEIPVSTNA